MRPKFQKRHYEAIAEVMDTAQSHAEESTFIALIADLAIMFQRDNPYFNRTKFGLACGLTLPIGN